MQEPSPARKRGTDQTEDSNSTQLRYLAEAIPQMVWTCSADGQLEYANELFCNYSNRPYEFSLGDKWLELCHPDEVKLVRQSFRDNILKAKAFEAEFRWLRADGVFRWHHCSVIPLKDTSGKIYRWLGTNTDMQDQKQARERIFRAVFDNSYQLMTLIDVNGKILEANAPALKVIGRKLKDVKGTYLWESDWFSYSADAQQRVQQSILAAAKGELVRFELSHHGVDGKITYFDYSVKPIFDEHQNPTMLIAEARNITERKLAEQQIRDSENYYRGIFEDASDLIVSVTSDGAIIYANQAWYQALGYNRGPVQLVNFFDVIIPEKKEKAVLLFENLKNGGINGRIDTTLCAVDGRTFDVEGSLNKNSANNMRFTTAILRDVTARKHLQQKVDEFYSNVSHELRTPLTSIRASLGLLENGLAGPISDNASALVKIGRQESERLVRMVNDILDIKKVESGHITLNRVNINAAELVQSTCKILECMALDFGVQLSCDIRSDLSVSGDADRLAQVLTNFISNALKFSPAGSRVNVVVDKTDVDQNWLRFTVQDNGPGIVPGDLHKLFGMFQQLSQPVKKELKGSGLGLAFSKTLIELHDGRVGCTSTPGVGSEFWFELPIAPSSKKASHASSLSLPLFWHHQPRIITPAD